jgi:hypothetical protein
MRDAKSDRKSIEQAQKVEFEALKRALAPHFVFESWENGLLQLHPHSNDTLALVRDIDDGRFGSSVAEELRRVGALYMLAAERVERALDTLKTQHKPASADAKATSRKAKSPSR